MPEVPLQITRLADSSAYPGWVECLLVDAFGGIWEFLEKIPVVTGANLGPESNYPQPGILGCEIVEEWIDNSGRKLCRIDSEKPWGIEAKTGETQFVVLAEQVLAR